MAKSMAKGGDGWVSGPVEAGNHAETVARGTEASGGGKNEVEGVERSKIEVERSKPGVERGKSGVKR